MDYIIREAQLEDAREIHDIYGYYVSNTFITFSEINPTVEEYKQSIIETKKSYPYIVACDLDGRILGMAYAGVLRHHDAYRFSVESTIYLAPDCEKGCGIGRALYEELERQLADRGYKFMYGVITDINEPSMRFHEKLGFEKVGHFTQIGYKFGEWKGIVWYRKQIGNLDDMTLNIQI